MTAGKLRENKKKDHLRVDGLTYSWVM